MVLIAPNGGMYFGYKTVPTGAGADHNGFAYFGSQILSHKGDIYIQAGGDVIFEGNKGFAQGNIIVDAQGDIVKKKVSGNYIDHRVWGPTGGTHTECRRIALIACAYRTAEDNVGWIDKPASVTLDVDFASQTGDVVLNSKQDIKVSGDIYSGRKIIFKGRNIKLEALKVYNERGLDGKGDHLQIAPTPSLEDTLAVGEQNNGNKPESNTVVGGGGIGFNVPKLIAQEGVHLVADNSIVLEAPIIFSEGDVKIMAKSGDIVGVAMFANYIDKLDPNEVKFAISGNQGVLATLKTMLLFAPQGTLSLKGVVVTAENIEAIAKEIELSGQHETVIQYTRTEKNRLFSRTVRETWQSHTAVFLTEMAAKHIRLTATEGDISLKGVNIQAPEGEVNINAQGNMHIDPYKYLEFYKTRVIESGFTFPGIAGAAVDPHQRFGDSIVSHIPALNAVDNLKRMKSPTDLAPAVQFGAEALKILTATSVTEIINDQLGITSVNGIPIPSGISWYKRERTEEERKEVGVSSTISTPRGTATIDTNDLTMVGSAIIAEDGEVYINANSFTHIPSQNQYQRHDTTKEISIGVSHSGSSSTVIQVGSKKGEADTSGYTYEHGSISANDIRLNIAGDAKIGSPILGNTEAKIGGNLILETFQDVLTTKANYKAISFGFSVNSATQTVTPVGSLHVSKGRGERTWAEVPAIIKGGTLYIDVGNKVTLEGGGILGTDVTVKARELKWSDVHSKDKYKETTYGVDSGVLEVVSGAFSPDLSFSNALTKSGELAGKASAIVKGWLSFGQNKQQQERVTRATISDGANIEIQQPDQDLSTLNRDENRMVETGTREETTFSIAIPVLDIGELESRWKKRETILQQALADKNLPASDKERIEAEQKVTKVLKDEAIKAGLPPEEVEKVVKKLASEEYTAGNLKKLSALYNNQEVPAEEVKEVLSGKSPALDEKGRVVFNAVSDKIKTNSNSKLDQSSEQQSNFWENYFTGIYESEKAEAERQAAVGEKLAPYIPILGPLSECTKAGDCKNWLTIGAIGLDTVLLIGTSGSGNVAKEVAKNTVKTGIKGVGAALDTIGKGAIVKVVQGGATHMHHSFPKFLGGDSAQELVKMVRAQHIEFHRELTKFLQAKFPEMVTKRGYSAVFMQRLVPPHSRIQALKEFYSGPGAKYTEAATEFFKQIN